MKSRAQYDTAAADQQRKRLTDLRDFHTREAAKYAAKSDEHERAGKAKAAARSRKVAERNERKAAEHAAELDALYD